MQHDQQTYKTTEKTVLRSLSLGGVTGGGAPCEVDVKGNKIVRIRPMRYDRHYTKEHLKPWKITRNGKSFEPLTKSLPGPFSLAYKKRAYSPNRIQFPLKRIDWDPRGERNPHTRGQSKYVRITWDEATGIIASEIKRIQQTYGPLAILCQGDGHAECKSVHAPHGCQTVLLEKMGGYTQQVRNPDSWEGWFFGAKHVWGNGIVGMMAPYANLTKDITENSDMVLFWGCDPETTPWGFTGQAATRLCYFWTEVGIKQIYICPDLNYGAAVHADKWIPIYPNTDVPSFILGSVKVLTTRSTSNPTLSDSTKWQITSWAKTTANPRRQNGRVKNVVCLNGRSKPYPEIGPNILFRSRITSAVHSSGVHIQVSQPDWNVSYWECKDWANRVYINAN